MTKHSATVGQAREAAIRLLGEMDLGPEFLGREPRQLSSGQQQRVALARALAAEPDVLLCDEITSALDVTIQAQVLRPLKRLQESRGLSCLFMTHDLAVVSEVAHSVLVLEKGEIREFGDTATVLASPKSPYTRSLRVPMRWRCDARLAGARRRRTTPKRRCLEISFG